MQSHTDVASSIVKSSRLKGLDVVSCGKNDKNLCATIKFDGRTLAFVRAQRKSIRIHVQDYGSERCSTVKTVGEAVALVKTSERRQPRAKALAARQQAEQQADPAVAAE